MMISGPTPAGSPMVMPMIGKPGKMIAPHCGVNCKTPLFCQGRYWVAIGARRMAHGARQKLFAQSST
jgi:hypothetical protein